MGAEIAPQDVSEVEAFQVWEPNWKSVTAFLDCETQWRVAASMSGLIWLGLDYCAVDVVLRRLDAPDHVFGDIQMMETSALAVLREG